MNNPILNLLLLIRPQQWTKNLLVFGALIFSHHLFERSYLIQNIIVFVIFCFLSSVVYILNDVVDAKTDALHPHKKNRPIPSGKISKEQAIWFALILLLCILALATQLNWQTNSVFLAYLFLNLVYSFHLKHQFLIDAFCIALGFVLRIMAGAVAIEVVASPWFVVTTFIATLFVAFSKRRADALIIENTRDNKDMKFVTEFEKQKPVMTQYTLTFTNQAILVSSALVIMTYCLYTIEGPFPHMMVTIPFVLFAVFKYLALVQNQHFGGEPELIFIKDRSITLSVISWLIISILVVYVS